MFGVPSELDRGPEFPLTWHLRKETAGSGAHADLNSHLVDLARYLVGDITEVTAMTAQFINERPLPDEGSSGAFQAGQTAKVNAHGSVTVEDAAFMLARFENGTLGAFEATRFAPGRKKYNSFEIYGSKGSVVFNVERMNELNFFSADDPGMRPGLPQHPGDRARSSLHACVVASRTYHRIRAHVRERHGGFPQCH